MRVGLSALESPAKTGGTGGSPGRYLNYLILGDGETKVVRFLTEATDLVAIKFHEFVVTPAGKFRNFVYAPDFNGGGEDWVVKYGGKTRDFTTKDLVPSAPRERIVGIAVEREEVPTEDGGRRTLRTQDKLSQFEGRDGKSYDARNFMVVKQYKTFWTTLSGYYHEFGSICDRDYKITRTGTGRDIVYSIIPKTPDPDWNYDGSSLAALQARYGYGTKQDMDGNPLTMESEDRFLYCRETLSEWLTEQASEENAREALAPDSAGPALNSSASGAPSWASEAVPDEPNAGPAPAASGTDVSSLRARLERHR
jgi:hypothetical protein